MVKKQSQAPGRGDVVWISLDPTKGHEQKGRRPAVVLSPKVYNLKAGLALVCPITNVAKGYPFEVSIAVANISGVVLSDQMRTIDWQARKVEIVGSLSGEKLQELQHKAKLLIEG
ncbi:MAG TPA: endoribonuclease MazF [Candidatus Paceibacterota bacterium]